MRKAIIPFHLNLRKKWFDMIRSGEKKEEYRGLHWDAVFVSGCQYGKGAKIKVRKQVFNAEDVTIIFSNGFAKDRPQFAIECKGIKKAEGNPHWGAEEGEIYFVLMLGKIVEV